MILYSTLIIEDDQRISVLDRDAEMAFDGIPILFYYKRQ